MSSTNKSIYPKIYYHIKQVYIILDHELSNSFPSTMREIKGYYNQFELIQGLKDSLIMTNIKPYFEKYKSVIFRDTPLTVEEIFDLFVNAIVEKNNDKATKYFNKFSILGKARVQETVIVQLTQHIRIVYKLLELIR